MALVLSGALSMGGSTADRSINCELGCLGTDQISLDDAAARTLAGVPSGEIAIDDFYGASSAPTVLGQEFEGGYYMGTISAASSSYFLIMAPNAVGCALCPWKTSITFTGVLGGTTDGYCNTYPTMENAAHPAGCWTSTRTIDGFSDWYLPARNEVLQLYTNQACAPVGEGFVATKYWSSSEHNSGLACTPQFNNGGTSVTNKTFNIRLRAMRRVPI